MLQVTQRWTVPSAAGPGPQDLSTVAHSYGSTVDPVADFYSGLFGVSMIAAKGALQSDGLVRISSHYHAARCALPQPWRTTSGREASRAPVPSWQYQIIAAKPSARRVARSTLALGTALPYGPKGVASPSIPSTPTDASEMLYLVVPSVARQPTLPWPSLQVAGVDKIQPLLFAVWDEAQSPYFNDNIANSSDPNVDRVSPERKSHSMSALFRYGPRYGPQTGANLL